MTSTEATGAREAADPRGFDARYPPLGVFETVEGVRLHLLEQGPRDGVSVALIHGASGNLRDFSFEFMARLSERYRVIAIDRPGFGHSQRGPADAHRPDVQARLMRGALARRGVERAVLVGHSFGAAPALAWALDAPDSVIGVLNLAGATHPWPGGVGLLYDIGASRLLGRLAVEAMSALIREERLMEQLGRIFQPQSAPEGYAEYVGVGLALRPATLRANAQDLARLKPFVRAQAPRYSKLRAPVEIIHGAEDRIVWASIHAEALAGAAPRARCAVLPGVGHMPHHAAPELCVAAIDRLAADDRVTAGLH